MQEPQDQFFVTQLEKLRDTKSPQGRAALAKLRRGLGKKMGTPEMYPYVVPFLSSDSSKKEQELYFLIAALFAHHPDSAPRGTSLGKVFRAMSEGKESIERRFTALLSADVDDIGNHMRQVVALAKSHGIAIDYHRLFFDFKKWSYSSRPVQLAWARDFWGYEKSETLTNSTPKGEGL
jgi:CRISPR system Cascade subunit CasB